jgi:hypothetical protein
MSVRSSLGSSGRFYGSNILPTPDPTIASCISDEDVALQLMRLGDASNFSYGRTSASTLDDGLSGRAEVASSGTSDGASDGDESDASETHHVKREYSTEQVGPPLKKQRRHTDDGSLAYNSFQSGDEVDMEYDGPIGDMGTVNARGNKVKKPRGPGLSIKAPKYMRPAKNPKSGSMSVPPPPMSPSSLPPPSRKTSASALNFQHQMGVDEEDLSSKPRCQRCRKSKKGCDRQRPCGRCKDAGIGIEGCVSEDENNGRKGRYGRHMGVSIKRATDSSAPDSESERAGAILTGMVDEPLGAIIKKRKR